MSQGFYTFCGAAYAAFKTGIYYNSQLESSAGLHLISSDYAKLVHTPSGITTLSVFGFFNIFLGLTYGNTYVKKSRRYMTGDEGQGLSESVALTSASVGSMTKVFTSNLSAGLILSLVIEWVLSQKFALSTTHSLVSRAASILLLNLITLPSAFYVNYAISYNESSNGDAAPDMHPRLRAALQLIDRMATPGTHAMIANTPSNFMYVLEGIAIVGFITRFAMGKHIDDFSLSPAALAVTAAINIVFVVGMQVGYDVKYQDEIERFRPALYQQPRGYVLTGDVTRARTCSERLMDYQYRWIKKHDVLTNGSSAVYTSVIMTAGAFMLIYGLSADKHKFDSGAFEWDACISAAAVSALSIVVGVVADVSFLFEKNEPDLVLPQPAGLR